MSRPFHLFVPSFGKGRGRKKRTGVYGLGNRKSKVSSQKEKGRVSLRLSQGAEPAHQSHWEGRKHKRKEERREIIDKKGGGKGTDLQKEKG